MTLIPLGDQVNTDSVPSCSLDLFRKECLVSIVEIKDI